VSLYDRKQDTTTQYWTPPYVPGKRLTGKPVFVLTSKRTFSGAEEFSYNLKNLNRATIIGETTGGGVHPISGSRVGAVITGGCGHQLHQADGALARDGIDAVPVAPSLTG
jgi:hypothetical protein